MAGTRGQDLGHIRRRGESFEVRVYLGLDPNTRKKRYKSRTVKTDAEARKMLKLLLKESLAGPSSSATFGELVERWLAVVELSPTTRAAYDSYLKTHILPVFSTMRLEKVTAERLDRLYGDMKRKGLEPATVHKCHVIIHRILAQAIKWRWVTENVADFATPPGIPRKELLPPSPAAVIMLIATADRENPDFGCYLRVAAVTGARRGEMCGLHWSDIDLEIGSVKISKAVVIDGKGVSERGTKTGNIRRVSLDAQTLEVLQAHYDRSVHRAETCGRSIVGASYVFSEDVDGTKPWRPDGVTQRFMRLRTKLGLNVRLHDLRHFVATQALAANIPARNVAGRLGHARTSMTTDVYADWMRESDQVVADMMGDVLKADVESV